nr:MAG TPA: hypothetical protein [Caudoviricetes sp.]DAP55815.1 MAG TPA: hypothetical protein [Caudoviricetes sp.]
MFYIEFHIKSYFVFVCKINQFQPIFTMICEQCWSFEIRE